MAYKNFYYDRETNTCHLWTDEEGREYQVFKYEKYAYALDEKGEHTTLTGEKVKKVKKWDKEEAKLGKIFEHDVPISTRILVDRYYQSDEPSNGVRVMFFDIEVEKGLKYSTTHEANNPITSIAYYIDGKYTCLLLDEGKRLVNEIRKVKVTGTERCIEVNLKVYEDERSMLHDFVAQLNHLKPDILSGYNSDIFDSPYLYTRICNVLGHSFAKKLSPIQQIDVDYVGSRKDLVIDIAGIAEMDYLQLYKKFTYNEEASYTLENISQKELGRGKFKYEGTLDDLFNNDPDGFIEYNVNDVELLVAMDSKLRLIDTARGICHVGHVPYNDYAYSSKYLEGAALVFCKKNNVVAIRSTLDVSNAQTAIGAAVKVPSPGLFRLIIDCDITSMYPQVIRTLNISPETIRGKVLNWNESEWLNGKTNVYTVQTPKQLLYINREQFWSYITDNQYSISSSGVLFDKTKAGLLPSILSHWFNERKRLSKLAEEYGLSGDTEKYRYYDQKQLIQKILLNSFYGVLLLPSFRFYNKDLGESVTVTGQSIIKFSMMVANKFCNDFIGTEGIDYVLSSDTDSIFISVVNLINPTNQALTEEEEVRLTLDFAGKLQEYLNKSYNYYATKLHNVEDHFIHIKQEMIAKVGFFGQAKKRYALKIINNKGVPVNKVEIKGIDVVRSSFPKSFRKFMKGIITSILDDVPPTTLNSTIRKFKDDFKTNSIFDIMLPTSVKDLMKYKAGQKGTPIYYKAAQNYNKMLALLKIESLPPISDGDKIVYTYMKPNPYGFESFALKGQDEDPRELVEFVEKFIDKEAIFEKVLLSKLSTIWTDLGWGEVQMKDNDHSYF